MNLLSRISLLVLLIAHTNALDNGLALTPPMGWMSWTAFYCEMNCTAFPTACINQQLYMDMADVLVKDGYKDAGYARVHVDDCWLASKRNSAGQLESDPDRFPDGIHALATYMHNKGLLFGIYEDYGLKTCAGFPGSYGYIETDANTFAAWECDYLKFDGCYMDPLMNHIGYPEMASALNATGRPILYSCEWPLYLERDFLPVNYSDVRENCNVWRNHGDVSNSWRSIRGIIEYYDKHQNKFIPYHGPGGWFDPDMIVVGNPGVNLDMSISQMTIWSIWSAPLILSNDLRIMGDDFKKVMLNRDVIAIDQDPLGNMGKLVRNDTHTGIYLKTITPSITVNGNQMDSYAIAVLNRNDKATATVSFTYGDFGFINRNGYLVKELWSNNTIGIVKASDTYTVTLNPAGSVLLRAIVQQ